MKNIKQIQASYYKNNDMPDIMLKTEKNKKVNKARTKRITMNITQEAYEGAHDLDRFMGMGYQNVLKTAIILGLKELHAIILREK